ncbi:ProQ/FINO family protein [Neptunomonas marina]|uniref:ProQ/FINO family protein n=1 Tax=Neptunomonas marina TaxID=1815562 RepID=UPI001F0BB052|nr:ProQ/FinO family protein [Neptunomonas marina]
MKDSDDLASVVEQTARAVAECEKLLTELENKAQQADTRLIERKVVNDEVTPKSKNKSKNRAANQAALQLLIDTYPDVFSRDNVRPLKIGIQEDLIADEKVAKNKIKRALASYVRAPQYFKAMVEDADRVDLSGEAVGKVTAEEALHAKEKLKEFHQRRREAQREREKAQREQEKAERMSNKLEQLVSRSKR